MTLGDYTSIIAITVVGLVGLLIIAFNIDIEQSVDIDINWNVVGHLLVGFAILSTLMYTILPLPTIGVKAEPVELFLGGEPEGGEFENGSVLDTITGGYLQKDTNTTLPTSHLTYRSN